MKKMKELVMGFWKEEEGLGTLEILLIVAVLVGVALLFKNQITGWVGTLLDTTDTKISEFDPATIEKSGNN